MNLAEMLLLSTGLAMDAFAVSIAAGLTTKQPKLTGALKIAVVFGIFQASMPFLGWLLANNFGSWVEKFDHWIAFCLLFFIGAKMIFESFKRGDNRPAENPLKTNVLLTLAFATSVDAFAAGISFSFLKIAIFSPVIMIGIVTFVFSFAGVKIGSRIGHYLEHKVTVLGGLVLIGFGVKILAEHLTA